MKFSESLKKNKDFQIVYRTGNSLANRSLVMYKKENGLGKNRLGRHHLTRLVRESYRLQEEHFKCGYDIVIVVRVSAKEITYADMESALIHLGKLHDIYNIS